MISSAYLTLYNLISCLGWAHLLFLTITSYLNNLNPVQFWELIGDELKIVQTAAVLEILHPILKLVNSPVSSVFLQVGSRLMLLWGYTAAFPEARNHWALYLMVGSWSLVEVPRYLFYALSIVAKQAPFPVFWLRYNLFTILYPTGITGELLIIYNSLALTKTANPNFWYFSLFLLSLYVPFAPFLFGHMVSQGKSARLKREQAGKPAEVPQGIVFPLGTKKDRSTTEANRACFAASTSAIDSEEGKKVLRERDWRFGYARHVIKNTELSCKSPEAAVKAAEAGLKYLHENFEFIREGKTYKLQEAMDTFKSESFETGVFKGTGTPPTSFVVPYAPYDAPKKVVKNLQGEELIKQLDKWASYGTIEPECRDAIKAVATNNNWIDLSDKYFVLIGAGAAMGPLKVLLAHRANIIAIDIGIPGVWERIFENASQPWACGTLYFPMKEPQNGRTDIKELAKLAGCDLSKKTPEIRNWLQNLFPGKQLIIGCYAYLDSAQHVIVSLASDAIMKSLIQTRGDIGLGFLCSPTDVFVCPNTCREAMIKNYNNSPWWQKLLCSLGIYLKKNARNEVKSDSGKNFSIVNGLVVAQGPNYALAKRLQHWRVLVARSQGCITSSNIAPSTATLSVIRNKQFKAAYDGMYLFKPMEVMYEETSNAVMGALLIHDIRNPNSVAYPSTPLENPLQLFGIGAFHGGIWRCGFTIDSLGPIAFIASYVRQYSFVFYILLAIVVALIGIRFV